VEIAQAMQRLPAVRGLLSLSNRAEVLATADPPSCDLLMPTYGGMAGFLWRWIQAPVLVPWLAWRLRKLGVDLAVCAMAGPLDPLMLAALRLRRVPAVLVVHDADPHPGEIRPVMVRLQRLMLSHADVLVALSAHVAERLRQQRAARPDVPVLVIRHPPRHFGPLPPPPLVHGGPLRLLFFGRLLPYKGLDLLADALAVLGPRPDLTTRIVGSGPEGPALDALRALDGVTVENRWVPEEEIGEIIAWADALVLPYREASQSGAAAAAVAAGRYIVATRVGGLVEQVQDYGLTQLCEPTAVGLASALREILLERAVPVHHAAPAPRLETWEGFAEALLRAAGRGVRQP
jgi:glycosyltransferase involved in cell wall biosynthesis